MKRFIWTFAIIALITSCRSQQCTVHDAQCTVIRDSVSVTYKQGQEQPASIDAQGAAIESICVIEESGLKQPCQSGTLTSCKAQSTGKGGALATRNKKGAAIAMAVNSPQGVRNSEASGRIIIRVDTVFVERWHTQTIREPTTLPYEGKAGKGSFYRHCTWGFFILILLFLGRIAFKLTRLFYLSR